MIKEILNTLCGTQEPDNPDSFSPQRYNKADVIAAVTEQTIGPWYGRLSAGSWDTVPMLDQKEAEVFKLRAWVQGLSSLTLREAYGTKLNTIQYTLDARRAELKEAEQAKYVIPSLPELPSQGMR